MGTTLGLLLVGGGLLYLVMQKAGGKDKLTDEVKKALEDTAKSLAPSTSSSSSTSTLPPATSGGSASKPPETKTPAAPVFNPAAAKAAAADAVLGTLLVTAELPHYIDTACASSATKAQCDTAKAYLAAHRAEMNAAYASIWDATKDAEAAELFYDQVCGPIVLKPGTNELDAPKSRPRKATFACTDYAAYYNNRRRLLDAGTEDDYCTQNPNARGC